ncbi:Chaperone protein HtpG [hydrothermal vent metagenome]|uniref:Chaperone protein HtpG n=1 Tax=hydrothermal vent metagenome TaxID=652676 RepID=A0A3B0TV46_9ZZZZ
MAKTRTSTTTAAKGKSKPKPRTQTKAFTAEVSRLLEILVHSVYADRDIFLRELISNAADACDRLRYEAVTDPALTAGDEDFGISIIADASAGTLTVKDNGIGMSRDELVENLGTIARSGTRAFVSEAEKNQSETAAPSGLIGQFGVGFYSSFIVAENVEVISRRAGSDEVWAWVSDGTGAYSISPVAKAKAKTAPARGTIITLTLRDGDKDFANPDRLAAIVRAHSDHIQFPIDIFEIKDGNRGEPVRANAANALWARPKRDVTEDQYKDFYGSLTGLFDNPAITIHTRAEGRHEYSVLLFVPESRPFDLYEPSRKSGVKLYVRRVLIDPEAALLPPYLRFVRGVVDSEDMPLTISRDMLQQNPVADAIRRAITKRVLSALQKEAEAKPESFAKLWEAFGAVIKEGLYEDYERRDDLLELVRFKTTASEDLRSLKDYVADMKPNQTAIYTLTGDDPARIAASPQLEGFRARGLEVLLLTDPVDSFWTQGVMGYDGKPFRSITQGAADLGNIPVKAPDDAGKGEDDKQSAPPAAELATAIAFIKQTLGDTVADVTTSDRLVDSPACLVSADGGPDRGLERLMRERGKATRSAPVLEINPEHKVVAALARRLASGGDQAKADAADAARTLFDYASIADGVVPDDPKAFGKRLAALLEASLV